MRPTQVIADHRESKSGIGEYLSAFSGVRLQWENLSTGDYIIEQGAIFERKTASDFVASLIDQRLFSQAKRLAEQPLRAAFIIEGGSEDWSALDVRREALQGALITLSLIFDLPVFRSLNPRETANLLIYAGHQLAALREDTPRYRIYKAKRKWTQQLQLLVMLPTVRLILSRQIQSRVPRCNRPTSTLPESPRSARLVLEQWLGDVRGSAGHSRAKRF
jgi:DNA excision repair protein ERCC-4